MKGAAAVVLGFDFGFWPSSPPPSNASNSTVMFRWSCSIPSPDFSAPYSLYAVCHSPEAVASVVVGVDDGSAMMSMQNDFVLRHLPRCRSYYDFRY